MSTYLVNRNALIARLRRFTWDGVHRPIYGECSGNAGCIFIERKTPRCSSSDIELRTSGVEHLLSREV